MFPFFLKNNQISNFLKISPLGAELFRVDTRTEGRTDGRAGMTKLIVAFRNFSKAPNNEPNVQARYCHSK
jgi:hypothetical protein